MIHHSVNVNDLESLCCTSALFSYASRAADTATFSFRIDTPDGNSPWQFGDEVSIIDDYGRVIFHGYVTKEPQISVSTDGMSVNVTLSNFVALLDATPFIEDQSFRDILSNEDRFISADTILRRVLEAGKVLPGGETADGETFDIRLYSTVRCPSGSGSQSCWSLINSCLHWLPNAITTYFHDEKRLLFNRAPDYSELTLDLERGAVMVDGHDMLSFSGYESADFIPRRDLCPPAVGLSWEGRNKSVVFPEGGNLRQPWAFNFQIPEMVDSTEMQKNAASSVLVLGRKVPEGWKTTANMREAVSNSDMWHKFWCGFPEMRPLSKTNLNCLQFGSAVFEPVPIDEAFPKSDLEDSEQPANYHEFVSSEQNLQLFVMYQGQFPASSEKRDNVRGLEFCKGKLKQYVWLRSDYAGSLSAEDWQTFFAGTHRVDVDGVSKKTRYALLELDAVFINRRRKKFQAGTNRLDATDPDYSSTSGDGAASDADYISAAEDYFNATRKLYYDGSITLRGISGFQTDSKEFDPGYFMGAGLNIIGARREWENMCTPVVQLDYDLKANTLTISTGSPEILTIDERVQRTLLGRQSAQGAGTSFMYAPRDEESEFPMISPTISVSSTVTKSGKPLNPFQLFSEGEAADEKWYINEGTLPTPEGIVHFETTEVTEFVGTYDRFSVVAEYTNDGWKAVVRKHKKK